MIAMSAQIPPVGEARDDYAIFCDLAARLGIGEQFSEGRDAGQWLRQIYEAPAGAGRGIELPSFDEFWQQGVLEYRAPENRRSFWRSSAPTRSAIRYPPLAKLNSTRQRLPLWLSRMPVPPVVGYGRGGPAAGGGRALAAASALQPAAHPSAQPVRSRQRQPGDENSGRELLWMHPQDAQARGIVEGSVVKVYNARGRFSPGAS